MRRSDYPSLVTAALWAGWWGLLAFLTWSLVSPVPQRMNALVLPTGLQFWASKAVHVGAYAFLAAYVHVLPAGWRTRAALWTVLALHAPLTEYLQTLVPGRYGCKEDVFIDLTGLSLGLLSGLALTHGRALLRPRSSAPAPAGDTGSRPTGSPTAAAR